ncbi:hypothetical protein NMY22_g3595 [Coprinellus aureogranulatus]|nr:hypothetical protein NMY22_g3595 [Coprinellus aureogranulatus]
MLAAKNRAHRKKVFGGSVQDVNVHAKIPKGFNDKVANKWEVGSVKGVGDGPRALAAEETLLNADGIPKTLA